MGLITKEVEVTVSSRNWAICSKYKSDCKVGDKVLVKIEDLGLYSRYKVIVACDYCGKEVSTQYNTYNNSIKTSGSFCCHDCRYIKAQKTCEEHFGVKHPLQSQEIKDKVIATNMIRYNAPYSCMNEEVRSKQQETLYRNYGVKTPFASEEIQERKNKTIRERYNVENVSQNEDIKRKKAETIEKHFGVPYLLQNKDYYSQMREKMVSLYGVPYAMQSEEIRNKANETLYKNGTGPCSIQQMYLYNLYGGELNYPFKYYLLDIAFPENKITLAYDGGGHDLTVKLGNSSKEEWLRKEIVRRNRLKEEEWKEIRINSPHDKLPSDEILLQMLELSKQYFKDYPNHSWFEWLIDEGVYRNAEEPEGSFFDYGSLRRIKDTDLVTRGSETVA